MKDDFKTPADTLMRESWTLCVTPQRMGVQKFLEHSFYHHINDLEESSGIKIIPHIDRSKISSGITALTNAVVEAMHKGAQPEDTAVAAGAAPDRDPGR